ncbi:MAG: hypothetical protein ABFD92_08650 [Planctomycetaceae bacterium]|nr:hypothetical protein [Planctomycetaceae bacterium]
MECGSQSCRFGSFEQAAGFFCENPAAFPLTVACDSQIINQAIDSGLDDFEDAIQFVCAVRSRSAYLVTRNPGHFRKADIVVVSPAEFLAAINPPAA